MELEKLGIRVLERMQAIEIIISNPGELHSWSGKEIEYGFSRKHINIGNGQWRVFYCTTSEFPHCSELNIFMECGASCEFYHSNGDGSHCNAEPNIISTKSLLEMIRVQEPEHVIEERDGYAKIDSSRCKKGKNNFLSALSF